MNLLTILVGLGALLFLLIWPGYITTRALFRNADALSPGELIFLPLAISVLISTWLGLVLAEFGWFSLPALIALVVLYSAAVWLWRRPSLWPLPTRIGTVQVRPDWIFLAILALGAVLAARPAEYILGGFDAGTYVNIGANIARTGAIAMHDPLVQSLPPDPGRQFFYDLVNPYMLYTQVRLPGFFIADVARGLVLPQFLHFYPVWLAIFDAALGMQWGLVGTPVIGLLGSVAAYFVARTLFGRRFAQLAFFLLVIDVPQFWFARYPVAEGMTQFLLLSGMYAFLRSPGLTLQEPTRDSSAGLGFPLLAGVAFAEIFLTRADSILLIAPLGLYALAVIFLRLWRREHWAFFLAFGAVFVQALLHMWVYAPDYVYYQYTHALRMKNFDKLLPGGLPSAKDFLSSPLSLLPLAGVAVAGLLLLWLLDRLVQIGRRRSSAQLVARVGESTDILRWLGAALVVALFLFAYFVWPRPSTIYAYIGGETTLSRAGNLIKFGWYLSPFGLALAVLGAVVVLRRDLNHHNVLLYGTGALFTVFYLEELYSNPHYIYTMRHYIPLVIPLFVLLAARALVFLWQEVPYPRLGKLTRVAAGGALALWLLYNTYAMGLIAGSRVSGLALRVPFVAQNTPVGPIRLEPFDNSLVGITELGGAFDQVQALAEMIDPRAVIIFCNNRDEPSLVATPLRYFYDRDALVARFNQPNGDKIAALIDGWRAEGRPVILAYGTNGGKLALPHSTLELFGHFTLDVPQWAFSYQYMPNAPWRIHLNYALYHVLPETNPAVRNSFVIDFGGDDYPSLVGGFLERPAGQASRWMGIIPDLDAPKAQVKTVSAVLRMPEVSSAFTETQTLDFALTARAPQPGTSLTIKSGKTTVGQVKLTREFATYHFALARAALQREGSTFLLSLTSTASTDPEGRILGAELKEAVISSSPPQAGN